MGKHKRCVRAILLSAASLVLFACGGSDGSLLGGGDDVEPLDPVFVTWDEGVYYDKALYQHRCTNPRSGRDPFNNNAPYPDVQGSSLEENFFLRSWTNDTYLWYDEVIDRNPALYSTPAYFGLLKTEATTPNGGSKDNFHFTADTASYRAQTSSGASLSYGMDLDVISTLPPREYYVRDVVPGSSAGLMGVERGMRITTVDGADLIAGDQLTTLNEGLFPTSSGETHNFVFSPAGGGDDLSVTLTYSSVELVPVKNLTTISTATGDVGYLHFNSHILPAERDLFEAFASLESTGVTDLVLDLRYNGGGFIYLAAQVGHLIAGAEGVGEVFYQEVGNDKTTPAAPFPFIDETTGFPEDIAAGISLPSLNLSRVFILSTSSTCSASEAIINGLRGVDVEVILIGSSTCGKPYGFIPEDHCGTTYFSVQFSGENAAGFGEYPDGFSPANESGALGVSLPGCWVDDDLTEALGSENEAMFAAALQYRENQTCPTPPSSKTQTASRMKGDEMGLSTALPPYKPISNNAIRMP